MTFASVFPHYITKVESKGRTKEELHQVIHWLTGFDDQKLQELIEHEKLIMWNIISLDGYFEGIQNWDLPFHNVVWGKDLEALSIEQSRFLSC